MSLLHQPARQAEVRTAPRRWPSLALLITLPAVLVFYLADPTGVGAAAYLIATLIALIAMAVGPWLHRPAHTLPWRFLLMSSILFLIGIVLRSLVPATGNTPLLLSPDTWSLAGYGMLILFLLALLQASGLNSDTSAALDALIAALGAAVVGWSVLIAPVVSAGFARGAGIVEAIYPMVDVLLIALALQLGFRKRSSRGAFRLMNLALIAMFLGDLGYAARSAGLIDPAEPHLASLFLAAFLLMGAAATHPSIGEVSAPRAEMDVGVLTLGRKAMLSAVVLGPTLLPLLWPELSALDRVVRAVLWAMLAAAVVTRLLMTVRRLREAEATARHRASHDPLTGLPNRSALMDEIAERVRLGRPIAILFADFDDFKGVNDAHGHSVGDHVLVDSARRLLDAAGAGDAVARVGGDEFVIVTDVGADDQVRLARTLCTALSEPFALPDGQRFTLTASVGIADAATVTVVGSDEPAAKADELLSSADLAMYHVKAAGRNGHAVFTDELRTAVTERLTMGNALRRALDAEELAVHFQPIKSVDGTVLTGHEALVRWVSAEYGPVRPDRFIPLAEEMGLIGELGRWVLRTSCRTTAAALRSGATGLHVSVNISPRQVTGGNLPSIVAEALAETGLPAQALWLEITESAMVENDADTMATFHALREMGVTLAIDDFGTGYSSLSYLKRLPVQVLKVDRMFVTGLGEDPQDEALMEAVVQLAHALDMTVVAEGVETAVQAERLRFLGCDLVQGYYFGRPAPTMELPAETQAVGLNSVA